MSKYLAQVKWIRDPKECYVDNRYNRSHEWTFDGGVTVPASSSPQVVPLPYSAEQHVDPEEAFVASLASCHMLFFLSIAAKQKFIVDSYIDDAVGVMEKNQSGRFSMTKVILKPNIQFGGNKQPTLDQLEKMHHQSHDQCFIANSVTTEVVTEIIA